MLVPLVAGIVWLGLYPPPVLAGWSRRPSTSSTVQPGLDAARDRPTVAHGGPRRDAARPDDAARHPRWRSSPRSCSALCALGVLLVTSPGATTAPGDTRLRGLAPLAGIALAALAARSGSGAPGATQRRHPADGRARRASGTWPSLLVLLGRRGRRSCSRSTTSSARGSALPSTTCWCCSPPSGMMLLGGAAGPDRRLPRPRDDVGRGVRAGRHRPARARLGARRRSSTSCWARSPRRSCCTASRWCTAPPAPPTWRWPAPSSPAALAAARWPRRDWPCC